MSFEWDLYLEPDVEDKRILSREDKVKSILSVTERNKKERSKKSTLYTEKINCRKIYNFCYPFEKYLEQMERIDVPAYDMDYQWNMFFLNENNRISVINLNYPWKNILKKPISVKMNVSNLHLKYIDWIMNGVDYGKSDNKGAQNFGT